MDCVNTIAATVAAEVQVKVNPFAGLTEELTVQLEAAAVVAVVVADQLVVVALPRTSAIVAPVNPTLTVPALAADPLLYTN